MADYDRIYWWGGEKWNAIRVPGSTTKERKSACADLVRSLHRDEIPHVKGRSTIGPPEGPPIR